MATSRLIILGVAVAAAGGAGYIAKNMLAAPPPKVVVQTQSQPSIKLTEVLVLTRDVPMGQPLADSIGWESWPADSVANGFIVKSDDPEARNALKGSLARVALYKGEPVRRAKLVGEGQSFMSSILPSGSRAVATQISAETSAGGFILPDDRVDVIMTRRAPQSAGSSASASSGYLTETILKNIRVLAIDQTIQVDEEGKKTKVGQTATLELTPEQAEIITVAQQVADRLTLALRSISDAEEKAEDQADYLVSGNGRRGTVRLIKSGEITEVGANQ